jgi:hypothetical protein
MSATEIVTLVLVFVAVLSAYGLGQRIERRSWRDSAKSAPDGNVPPVEVLLHYRNATGFTTRRKVKILAFVPRRNGRSCLFALGKHCAEPRTFRVDRIVSIATLDGKAIDTQQFLTEWLGVRP